MFSGRVELEQPNEDEGGYVGGGPREERFESEQVRIPNITRELTTYDTTLRNKLGDEEDNEFNKLLFFYRQRINLYDDERIEWLQKIEEMREN